MANVDGAWDCVAKTPMGPQAFTLTAISAGDTFTGTLSGGLGSMPVENGVVAGDTLHWKMDIKMPMALTLNCSATVTGDTLAGDIKLGAFGTAPLTGVRKG